MSVADRRARFHELHAREGVFVMPNPWDVGSARLLERCGFEALATTSAGYAWLLGKEDHAVTRDELVAHVAELTGATSVPLNVAAIEGTALRQRGAHRSLLVVGDPVEGSDLLETGASSAVQLAPSCSHGSSARNA